jgi:hypothetical protein
MHTFLSGSLYEVLCWHQSDAPCKQGTVGCRWHSSIQLLQSLMILALVMIQAMYSGIWIMGKHISRQILEG